MTPDYKLRMLSKMNQCMVRFCDYQGLDMKHIAVTFDKRFHTYRVVAKAGIQTSGRMPQPMSRNAEKDYNCLVTSMEMWCDGTFDNQDAGTIMSMLQQFNRIWINYEKDLTSV